MVETYVFDNGDIVQRRSGCIDDPIVDSDSNLLLSEWRNTDIVNQVLDIAGINHTFVLV